MTLDDSQLPFTLDIDCLYTLWMGIARPVTRRNQAPPHADSDQSGLFNQKSSGEVK